MVTPMSPKAESMGAGAGARPYMPPMAHSSPAASAGTPGAPHSARPAASYAPGSTPVHSQAPYLMQDVSPIPGGSAAPVSAPLPPIPGAYVRSPSFTGTQAAGAPTAKGTAQPQHAASLPLPGHATAATAHDEPAASPASYAPSTAAQATLPRMQQPPGLSSPGARPGAQPHPQHAQSPHSHQHTASAPPPKQAPSPRVHRAASAQSTPLPPHSQQSPRTMGGAVHAASVGPAAGATFAATPKAPHPSAAPATMATAAVPPLGPAHSMGTVARPSSATASSVQPQSAGLAITGAQNGAPAAGSGSSAAAAASGGSELAHRQQSQPQAQTEAGGRPLNVSDALSYLDMVKSQFHDRPEVYNQFLEIMKEFKSHAIDTPGVINRVSRLFHGSPALIQGFNTFLPPGYRIECSDDPSEGVRVTTPSGSIIPDMHRQASSVSLQGPPQSPAPASSQPAAQRSQHQQPYASRDQYAARRAAQGGQSAQTALQSAAAEANGQLGTAYAGSAAATAAASATAHSPGAMRSPSIPASQRSRGVPVEFNHAITYVNKIKMRFAAEPDRYKEFLEILQTYQKESRPIHEVYGQVQHLFSSAPDLLDEFKQFLPDTSEAGAGASALTGVGSPPTAYARPGAGAGAAAGGGMAQG
ncbi:Transcriptional regulatory protein sin3, partial [Coemansia biformis]